MKRVINFNIIGSLQYHISTLTFKRKFYNIEETWFPFGGGGGGGGISLYTKVHKGLGALLAICCPSKVNILCSCDNFNVRLVRKEKKKPFL